MISSTAFKKKNKKSAFKTRSSENKSLERGWLRDIETESISSKNIKKAIEDSVFFIFLKRFAMTDIFPSTISFDGGGLLTFISSKIPFTTRFSLYKRKIFSMVDERKIIKTNSISQGIICSKIELLIIEIPF